MIETVFLMTWFSCIKKVDLPVRPGKDFRFSALKLLMFPGIEVKAANIIILLL